MMREVDEKLSIKELVPNYYTVVGSVKPSK